MKRGGPLKRTPLPRRTEIRSASKLARASSLTRSPMRRKPRKARPGADPTRLRWVRTLPCCCGCGAPPPSHAHHPRHGVGLALKAPDADAFPLAQACHRAFHERRGFARGWGKERAADWEREQTAIYQARYERERGAA